ncbi:MAG: OAM dimerization domain-containing protein [Clostridia bacterium]
MSGLYDLSKKSTNTTLDTKQLCPYGDTINDSKVQISFTLPIPNNAKGNEAAALYAKKMGIAEPNVAYARALDDNFTFYVVYGSCVHTINYDEIVALDVTSDVMDMRQVDEYIERNIGRKVVVLGASTGTDAHTVGIDAIMNRKGFAGHYGLERYNMIEAINMGSQVANEDFIKKAREVKADILLVSQTVTQKNIHIANLTELVELLEADNLRKDVVLICGGARINHELAKELGYDAGFGSGKFAEDVISFAVQEMVSRKLF